MYFVSFSQNQKYIMDDNNNQWNLMTINNNQWHSKLQKFHTHWLFIDFQYEIINWH